MTLDGMHQLQAGAIANMETVGTVKYTPENKIRTDQGATATTSNTAAGT